MTITNPKYTGVSDIPEAPICFGTTEVNQTGSWRTFKPVLVKDKCVKCYLCWKYCPEVSIKIDSEGYPEFNYYYCKGCGICANECRKQAIKIEPEGWE